MRLSISSQVNMNQSALILRTALLLLMMMYGTDARNHTISINPGVLVGDEIIVLCNAGADGKITWFKDGEEINDEEKVLKVDEAASRMIIKKATMQDAGRYTCHCEFNSGHSDKTEIQVYVYEGPSFGQTTIYHEFLEGTEGKVPCLVTGQPAVDVQWFRDHHAITSHEGSDMRQLPNNTLLIKNVKREDAGTYECRAQIRGRPIFKNLSVSVVVNEAPEVFVSAEQQSVSVGKRVSVSCNVSGHPQPELHWLNKHNGHTVDSSGHVRVVDGALVIEEVLPSDGGLYSCMAISTSGNASKDVAIHTQPGQPHDLTVLPGPSSVLFSLKTLPISGGTAITHFALQWKQSAAEPWKEVLVPASDTLAITGLRQYTLYTVHLAAMNAVGEGPFSDPTNVRTLGIREPDSQGFLVDEKKAKHNSLSIPVKQNDDGGRPLQHFTIRCRQDKDGAEWKEMQLSPSTDSISLKELCIVSSPPAVFTDGEQPVSRMTEGTMIVIVMVIFLVVFLVVDATCCYRNQCGLLMSIAVKLFGYKAQGLKLPDKGQRTTNAQVKLIRISTLRSSTAGVQAKEGGQLTEVTCDKASLTKHEKIQPDRDLHHANV